jgi:TonB family protein
VNTGDKVSGLGAAEVASSRSSANLQVPVVQMESEPPPPAPRPILKPMSGGVLNGTAISLPSPTYPDAARRLRMGGLVSVEVVVDETGKVISAVATSGPAMLREVAVQAAMRARFSPTKLSGQPVKVSGVINYKFSLSQ